MGWFDHFLAGGVPREEAASALLAASLEHIESFRRHFFGLVVPGLANELSPVEWRVAVEESRVDVTLESEDTAVLIENKIKTAAMTDSTQLVRYYRDYVSRHPHRRVVVVLATPSGRGQVFVDAIRKDEVFASRTEDIVARTTWDQLAAYDPSDDDRLVPFAAEAISAVADSAALHAIRKSTRQSTGIACAEVVERAYEQVSRHTSIPLQYWGPDAKVSADHVYYQMLSTKCPITVWSGILVPKAETARDIDELADDPLCLIKIKLNESRLQSRIKKGDLDDSSLAEFRDWWGHFTAEVPIVDKSGFVYDWDAPRKWLVNEFRADLESNDLVDILRDTTLDIIRRAEDSLRAAGLYIVEP